MLRGRHSLVRKLPCITNWKCLLQEFATPKSYSHCCWVLGGKPGIWGTIPDVPGWGCPGCDIDWFTCPRPAIPGKGAPGGRVTIIPLELPVGPPCKFCKAFIGSRREGNKTKVKFLLNYKQKCLDTNQKWSHSADEKLWPIVPVSVLWKSWFCVHYPASVCPFKQLLFVGHN